MSFLAGTTAAAFHRSTADQRVDELARLHPCLMIQGLRQGFRQDAVDPLPQEVAFRRAVAARQCAKPLVLISLDINLFSLHASHGPKKAFGMSLWAQLSVVSCRCQLPVVRGRCCTPSPRCLPTTWNLTPGTYLSARSATAGPWSVEETGPEQFSVLNSSLCAAFCLLTSDS